MVRLCVPAAGDDQHGITRKSHLGFFAAEPTLLESPARACICAAVTTAFRSVLGLARPGTFLRTTAVFGLIDGSITAADIYGRQELNRAVFKQTGLDNPQPWKLWERTKHWTAEDMTLWGGGTGLLLASNPRLFPGATGWTRFLGISIAGCAIGAKTGEWLFSKGSPHFHLAKRAEQLLKVQRVAMYRRLSEDEEAKASLSRFARSLLMVYTGDSPLMQILGRPFQRISGMPIVGSHVDNAHGAHHEQQEHFIQMQEAHARQTVVVVAEFEQEELAGPDYERGYREFHLDPVNTDLKTLQDHLEHLHKLRAADVKELAHAWRKLAQKEHYMHQLSQDDPERDMLARELQLLNSLAVLFNARIATFTYAQADARKRIGQIRNEDPASVSSTLPCSAKEDISVDGHWDGSFIPQKSVETIRRRWEQARSESAQVEHVLSQFDGLKAQGSTDSRIDRQADQLRSDWTMLKKNIIATERLLKEYEDDTYRADAKSIA